ncbi:MAG: hypothetical protein AAF330_03470 [Pseudomonadota bacterium]
MSENVQQTAIAITPDTVLPVLRTLEGTEAGVCVAELVEMITGEQATAQAERHLRHAITELRMRGHPVCATPRNGYFWGVTAQEVEATATHLARRSLTGLTQANRMTGRSIQELTDQLALELEGGTDG